MKFIFSFFLNFLFGRKIQKRSVLALIFWGIFLLILGILIVFVQKKEWFDATSIVGLVAIGISLLATVLRLGLFSNFSLSYHKWRLESQNKALKKKGLHVEDIKIDYAFIKEKQKQLSWLPIFTGYLFGLVLIIISTPFLAS